MIVIITTENIDRKIVVFIPITNERWMINLSHQWSKVQISSAIGQGETDRVASTKLVEELVAKVNNYYLSCKVITHTGHMPGVEIVNTLSPLSQEQSQQF